MLNLINNQPSKFEAVRNLAEGQSGGFDIMRMRFSIVKNSLINVENSPTISRALETVRRLEVASQTLEFNQEIERLAAETIQPVAKIDSPPPSEADNREAMAAYARSVIDSAPDSRDLRLNG